MSPARLASSGRQRSSRRMGPAAASSAPSPPARRRRGESRPEASRSAPAPPPVAGSCHHLQQTDHLAENSRIDTRPDPHDRAADLDLVQRRSPTPAFRGPLLFRSIAAAPDPMRFSATKLSAPAVELIAVQPVAQCDLTRHRPRRQALRDGRRLLPPCSSGAVGASRSEPPLDGNYAHQLANYLAHQPHCLA